MELTGVNFFESATMRVPGCAPNRVGADCDVGGHLDHHHVALPADHVTIVAFNNGADTAAHESGSALWQSGHCA